MGAIENINWYPGHMKKTGELIRENLKLVDAVLEVVDARIPISGRNPIIGNLVYGKIVIVILNKSDLSDAALNRRWAARFKSEGKGSVLMNGLSGEGVKTLLKLLSEIQAKRDAGRARRRPLRVMIAGAPNVGKSSLINRLVGKRSAKTGDRPGVTKGKQWLALENGVQLLDTPGMLWPKFEDPKTGLKLAFCGSVRDEILDMSALALELIAVLRADYPRLLAERYKLTDEEIGAETLLSVMDAIAARRGFLGAGGRADYERTGRALLDEFRAGRIGRITLEKPPLGFAANADESYEAKSK